MPRKTLYSFATIAGAAALAACSTTTTEDSMATDSTTAQSSRTPAPSPTPTPTTTMVGGAEMLPSKTIVENASQASNLTTLVAAVKAAGLVETLSGPGPFTVFAPDNDAFSRLPPGTVDTLMKPANKETLKKVLTYHVLPGKFDAAAIKEQIKAGGGTAQLTTVEGDPLTATLDANDNILLTSGAGAKAYITTADVEQSNGIVHVINGVEVPDLTAGAKSSSDSMGDDSMGDDSMDEDDGM